jgi:hypothetical protein
VLQKLSVRLGRIELRPHPRGASYLLSPLALRYLQVLGAQMRGVQLCREDCFLKEACSRIKWALQSPNCWQRVDVPHLNDERGSCTFVSALPASSVFFSRRAMAERSAGKNQQFAPPVPTIYGNQIGRHFEFSCAEIHTFFGRLCFASSVR